MSLLVVTGTLKGYDQLMNLVMDDVVEEFEGKSTPQRLSGILEHVEGKIWDVGQR